MAEPTPHTPLTDLLVRVHDHFLPHTEGEVAAFAQAVGGVDADDFGLARATSANTATGQMLLGTIAYLALPALMAWLDAHRL